MKVLFLLNGYVEDGPGMLTLNLIQQFKTEEGIDCHTAALKQKGPLEEHFRKLGVSTICFNMRRVFEWGKFRQLVEFLGEQRFDIILTNLIRADILGRIAARKAQVPVILTIEHGIHTWRMRGALVKELVRLLYVRTGRVTKKIIAVSDFVQRELIKNGIPEEKVVRIYNGVDPELFRPLSGEEKKGFHKYLADFEFTHLVGGVGHLVTLKGHSYFLQAIPLVLEEYPDTFFVVVGEGPLHRRLVEEVEKLEISTRVKFVGKISRLTSRLVAALDVLVQPSLTESFGLAVTEAMAAGVPVVATEVGGLPEIVQDGYNGFLVEPANAEQIAEKVIHLLENPERAGQMGRIGRSVVEEKFNIQLTAREYRQLFEQLLREGTSP